MRPIRIAVHSSDPDGSCSFYRAWGPLNRLEQAYPNEFHVEQLPTNGWSSITRYDVVFIQRPYTETDLKTIQRCAECSIPVWVDYDDDFTCIPRDNPNWAVFADSNVQKRILECLGNATVVSVTTEALKNTLKDACPNVVVIPNAYDDFSLGTINPTSKRLPRIVWRGSPTHQNDLLHYKEEIVILAEEFPDIEWVFFGYYPFFLTEKMKKHKFQSATRVFRYLKTYGESQAAISIVPLVDNQFNRAKSNIAWLEATYAGAATVAPSFDSWVQPGAFNYVDKETFLYQCRKAIASMTGEVTEDTKKSAAYIKRSLSLSVINTLRAALVRAILGLSRPAPDTLLAPDAKVSETP